MGKVVDPHIHLFNLEQGEYRWLQADCLPNWPDKEKIHRSYNEDDLKAPEGSELSGFVHIEAGFDNEDPCKELAWLHSHCQIPFRSIAFLDLELESPIFTEKLSNLSVYPSFVGIRHILDDAAASLLSQPQVRRNLSTLASQELIFEAQLSLSDKAGVGLLNAIMTENPGINVIVNHCGSPAQLDQQWMDSVVLLAHQPECYMKCSGWEMLDREWNVEKVKPLVNFAIRQFGLTRVMMASNFPVSELSISYSELWQRYLKDMKWKGFEREMLCFENAKRIYQLDF